MKWSRYFIYFFIIVAAFLLSGYSTVSFLLKNSDTVICPDVQGKNIDDAKQIVQNKGLSLSIVKYEKRNDIPYNNISVQKPEANIPIRKGRVVMVVVSEGPEMVRVPLLTGLSVGNAVNKLEEVSLEIEKTIYVPGQKTGQVVAQIPKGGEEIIKGKGVTLFVGTEQNKFYMMPDLKTIDITMLSEEMDQKGIKYNITYENSEYRAFFKSVADISVPLKTIFKASDGIEIKVMSGG